MEILELIAYGLFLPVFGLETIPSLTSSCCSLSVWNKSEIELLFYMSKAKVKKEGEIYNSNLSRTLGRKVWLWGTMKILERVDLKKGRFQWACDECLNAGKALIGKPESQLYCDFDPYLVYIDMEKVCEKCDEEYLFKKEEQKYWYETLQFWVQSKPKHCSKCRHEIREERELNNELAALLKGKEKLTVKDMERLSKIYDEIKKPDKSKYYKNLVEISKHKIAS